VKLPDISSARIVKVLCKFGWGLAREGKKHTILEHPDNPFPLSIPRHRRIKRGTLRAILQLAGITIDEFREKM